MNAQPLPRSAKMYLACEESHVYQPLTKRVLHQENLAFQGTGGVSSGNGAGGFLPAFLDTATGMVYLARYADGRLAPMHLLDGLPEELVVTRSTTGKVIAAKESVMAGFVRCDQFFTREQAAAAVGG